MIEIIKTVQRESEGGREREREQIKQHDFRTTKWATYPAKEELESRRG